MDYKLTGRLRLSIDNLSYLSGPVRGTWSDGKIQRVEDCLGDFVVGVKVAAAAIKKNRQETEEWARRREEERKQREEQQRLAEEHKRKAEFGTELIENWEEAQRVRTFVRAMTPDSTVQTILTSPLQPGIFSLFVDIRACTAYLERQFRRTEEWRCNLRPTSEGASTSPTSPNLGEPCRAEIARLRKLLSRNLKVSENCRALLLCRF